VAKLGKPIVSAPALVKGRKGRVSVVDCMVAALWRTEPKEGIEWPAKTFETLREEVSSRLAYPVGSSTIRSTVYGHSELFQRASKDGKLCWRLTDKARRAGR